jgi:hypothetical protein
LNIPSFERLSQEVGKSCVLLSAVQGAHVVELVAVSEGTPMNARHRCYSAEFALPFGAFLSQGLFTLTSGQDVWPDLLFTPIGPDEDGRQLMQLFFHFAIASTPVAAVRSGG